MLAFVNVIGNIRRPLCIVTLSLFVLISGLLATANAEGQTSKASLRRVFETDEAIAGITSTNDRLFILTENRLLFVNSTTFSNESTKYVKLPPETLRRSPLRLLATAPKQSIVACDSAICWACNISACYQLNLPWRRRRSSKHVEEIRLASVAVNSEKPEFLLKTVSARESMTRKFAYDQTTGKFELTKQHTYEMPYVYDTALCGGFFDSHHYYLVGTVTRPYEPLISSTKMSLPVNQTTVRVTRICADDRTTLMESSISVVLQCSTDKSGEHVNEKCSTAKFDPVSRQLFAVFHAHEHSAVCSVSLDELNAAFDKTWDICQDTRPMDMTECYVPSSGTIESMPSHCFIFTRLADAGRSLGCSKFNGIKSSQNFTNCGLHESLDMAYRYGWLDSYVPVKATTASSAVTTNSDAHGEERSIGLEVDSKSKILYVVNENRTLLRSALTTTPGATPLRQLQFLGSDTESTCHFPLTMPSTQRLLIVDGRDWISEWNVSSCPSVYNSCGELMDAHFSDPLGCVFCADESGRGEVKSQNEEACPNGTRFVDACPPVVELVSSVTLSEKEGGGQALMLYGQFMNAAQDMSVRVCDQPCNVQSVTSTLLRCVTDEYESDCEVSFAGNVGSLKNVSIRAVSKVTDTSFLTGAASSGNETSNSASRRWKAIAIGICGILLLGGIIGIGCFLKRNNFQLRRFLARNGGETASTIPFNSANAAYLTPIRHNEYKPETGAVPEFVTIGDSYERLFATSFSPNLMIAPEAIVQYSTPIGKGYYGMVYLGDYFPSRRSGRQLSTENELPKQLVACKKLVLRDSRAGVVSEFIKEGILMSKFEHEHVLPLVGISITHDRVPLIITPYMEDGDLLNYIKNELNEITLRSLLTFAQHIASGMSYLHAHNFVHRDLAARNCMLSGMATGQITVKVSDFGMCREVLNDIYIPVDNSRAMPIRWMPIESLLNPEAGFTPAGDVWAFGVVVWELMTRGLTPYHNQLGATIPEWLDEGHRLEKPPYCHEQLYDRIMVACWAREPLQRPTFVALEERLRQVIRDIEQDSIRAPTLNQYYEKIKPTGRTLATSSGASTTLNSTAQITTPMSVELVAAAAATDESNI